VTEIISKSRISKQFTEALARVAPMTRALQGIGIVDDPPGEVWKNGGDEGRDAVCEQPKRRERPFVARLLPAVRVSC
jgi:hypothetical protein